MRVVGGVRLPRSVSLLWWASLGLRCVWRTPMSPACGSLRQEQPIVELLERLANYGLVCAEAGPHSLLTFPVRTRGRRLRAEARNFLSRCGRCRLQVGADVCPAGRGRCRLQVRLSRAVPGVCCSLPAVEAGARVLASRCAAGACLMPVAGGVDAWTYAWLAARS
jgi:hypothetical protein